MRLIPLLFLAFMAAVPALAWAAAAPTLAGLRDRARPLLIFAPTADDVRLRDQLDVLRTNAAEARERDLIAIAIPERGSQSTEMKLSVEEAVSARKQFHVGSGEFVVVLVGKDGGEKLRSREPISFEKLRSKIDAMPMRQNEMKTKP